MHWLVPYLVLTTGQALDTATTSRALNSGRCVEGNSAIYGSSPSAARLIVTKAASVAGASVAMWALTRSGHAKAAKTLGVVVGAAGGAAGGFNLWQCR